MVGADPDAATRAVLGALERLGVAAVVNCSGGGLRRPEVLSPGVFFTESVSYDYLMPRVAAVVHHGGSGTTHMAARAGRPQLVVPHIFDQYYWDHVVQRTGLGPRGIPSGQLDAERLARGIRALLGEPAYAARAAEVAEGMRGEADAEGLVRLVAEGLR